MPNQPTYPLILVNSSHGHFYFEPVTGKVLNVELGDEFGPLPVRVNVEELWAVLTPEPFRHQLKDGLFPEYDILYVGFWDIDGNYEPPAEDWRLERDKNTGETL